MFISTLPLTEATLLDAVASLPERPTKLIVGDVPTELVAKRIAAPGLAPPDWKERPAAVEGFDAIEFDHDLGARTWGLR